MTMDATTPVAEPPPATAVPPALSRDERRVLGVLVEKAKTTPDAYPLTLNALVTGCNQKSNRDPVLALSDADVETAMDSLKKKGLAQQIVGGGRVDRYRHVVYEALQVDKVQLAILAELWLRGPQTEGELRSRASRMEPIADLDALRSQLRSLAERRLAVYLTPEGRRGTIVTHGMYPAEELKRLKEESGRVKEWESESAPTQSPSHPSTVPDVTQRLGDLEQSLEQLRTTVQDLNAAVAELRADFSRLAPRQG